ncbi:SDR family NAD(P)-dependent oxidoreductase, partial [Streptomyces sp. NPDC049881]|uniref:SDR family NAD(P)-dependent oxidoreductase n=1 Tax=Streptomyces sp. NPDC049881 TaxID=3155778 RepID=UPI003448A37C
MTTQNSTRVALVTGGSGGIGKAAVRRLAADGYAVAVHYSGNKAAADALAAEITERGGRAIAVGADVADETAVEALFDETVRAFGGLDV